MEKDKRLSKYEDYLSSYAKSQHMTRECNGMWNVEADLLNLIDAGAKNEIKKEMRKVNEYVCDKLTKKLPVALAGVKTRMRMGALAMVATLPRSLNSNKSARRRLVEDKVKAIYPVAKWLSSEFEDHLVLFPLDKGLVLLFGLYEEYFSEDKKVEVGQKSDKI